MKKTAGLSAVLALSVVIAPALCLAAQTPAPAQQNPPADKQQPAQKPADSNPFPEDNTNVPVLPSANQPAPRRAPEPATEGPVPVLPGGDRDPVRSPDQPIAETEPSTFSGSSASSSSSADLGRILEPPPDEETRKSKKGKGAEIQEHKETAQEDENVGQYYLDRKNWRAALSRYQSALILDPDNPEVYWGLAESQRHLGDAVNAKANYMKVVEYDPDSKHGKEAKKLLKDPEMANAPSPAPSHP
ncbi:tetratricopeptide repeat protein [Occallatibacter riparius]|uniref:Tetratricopeptide repeat protein n=1 Tax=Occallatibacter riparius TaxID=1002689 RepID=A0A9J7BN53_9BACT|nr:tetratricopeptide repeat protein [Occallatibacter riparius]UWZ82342.1 tetratricopeptide repeat protein [Occallatibacter riparius]